MIIEDLPEMLQQMVSCHDDDLHATTEKLRNILWTTKSFAKKPYSEKEVLFALNTLLPKQYYNDAQKEKYDVMQKAFNEMKASG